MTRTQKAAALLALSLCLASGARASEMVFRKPEGRPVNKNVATTLANLPEKARERSDTLVIGVTDLYGCINPFFAETMGDQYTASLLFDELVFANVDGAYGTGIASYQFDQGTGTFTFKLQDKVTYGDGTPVLSDDFINALYLVTMPGFDGAYDLTGAGIEGVDAYLAGERDEIDGIQRVDDRTFSVRVAVSNPDSIAYFAVPALRVQTFGEMRRPEALAEEGFDAFYAQQLAAVRVADVAEAAYGQYALTAIEPGEEAILLKNEAYFRGSPNISEVRLAVVPIGQELAAMMAGDIDIASVFATVELVDAAVDRQSGFINLYTFEGDALGYLGMNLESPVFAELAVRQALAIGLNRENLRQAGVERYGIVPTALMFDVFDGEAPEEMYAYNPERAAQLLDGAGWLPDEDGVRAKGETPARFTLHYAENSPVLEIILPLVQADFLKLGVQVQPVAVPLDALVEMVARGECEMYCLARRLPQDPAVAIDLFAGESHLNTGGFIDESFARDLKRARAEGDPGRRTVLYEGLYMDLYDRLPFIPLYRRSEMVLISARVMNANVSAAHEITADVFRFFLVDTLEGQW